MTVLAVDTVDSTGLIADVDPDQAQELLDRIFDHLKRAIEQFGGLLVSYAGDGGLAVFGWRNLAENHADSACEAAWRIQAPAAQASPLRSADGRSVQFRVGVHSGLVSLRSIKRDIRTEINTVGAAAHIAAVLQKSAPPDRILLSSRTVNLCKSPLQLAPYNGVLALPKVRVKAYELTAPPAPEASTSAFGNSRLSVVRRALERRLPRETITERRDAAAPRGEAGAGKIRLAFNSPTGFAERCMLTVLAVDTVDSTSPIADIDPDQAHELLDRIFDHLKGAIEQSGGLVVSFASDGGLAVFGWPNSLEDHADRACEAAWRIQAPAARAGPLRSADGRSVQFRVGVHSGLVSLRSIRRDVRTGINTVGGAVNLAAALQKSAPPERILLSSRTVNLCKSSLRLTPYDGAAALQKVRLKAYELTAPPAPEASESIFRDYRFPVVGRELERRILRDTLIERRGTVALIGEPGIGKTRLASTLIDDARLRGMRVLTFSGDNQKRTTPYAAARPLFLQSLSLKPSASDDELRQALSEAGAGPMKPSVATVLLEGRGAEHQQSAHFVRTQVARDLIGTFDALNKDTAALVVIDDLQLLDPESVLCLRLSAVARAQPHRSLLITARPEAAALARTLTDTALDLAPLPREDMAALARKIWPGAMPGSTVVEKVLDRADGVPFVLEQIALSEGIEVAGKENALPDSVQSVIHARLNHLSAKAKAFAQALSILGEEVDVDLASRTIGLDKGTLLRRRTELERLSIVHPLVANSIRFRHAIVAEACAETVPGARRQQIHRAAVEAILSTSDASGQYERLAFHAEGARDDAKALEYLWLAALNARRASASGSLYLTFRRAMTCIERIGEPAEEKFVDFVLMAFGSLAQIGEFRSLGVYLPRALELARKQNRKGKVCAALCHMALVSWFEARYAEERDQSEQALEIARELDSPPLMFAAKFNLAGSLYGLGELDSAIAVHRELFSLLSGDLATMRLGAAGIPGSIVRSYLGFFLTEVGGYDEGMLLAEEAIGIAKTQGEPYSEILALLAKCRILLRLKRHSEAIATLDHAVELIDRNGYDVILPHLLGTRATALARNGDGARAVRDVEAWLNSERADRVGPLELFYLNAGYAEALSAAGDVKHGLAIADRAVEIGRSVSNPCLMTHGLGLRARLRVLVHDTDGSDRDLTEQRDLCSRYGIVAET
jgi:class 3 adenylate cyclase/tetratricopeptide (TPR) repeat protein